MLTDLATVKAWARGKLDDAADDVLTRCILAASGIVSGFCDRDFEQAQYTETFSGDDAAGRYGEILHLDRGRFPVRNAADPGLITVTENGAALAVGTGYASTAPVLVDGIGMEYPARLIRKPRAMSAAAIQGSVYRGAWSPGVMNITVTYFAGYPADSIPAPIVQATCEAAWLLFVQASSIGVASSSKAGGSATFVAGLSAITRMALEDFKAR